MSSQNCHGGRARNACLVPVSSYSAGDADTGGHLFSKYGAETKQGEVTVNCQGELFLKLHKAFLKT